MNDVDLNIRKLSRTMFAFKHNCHLQFKVSSLNFAKLNSNELLLLPQTEVGSLVWFGSF